MRTTTRIATAILATGLALSLAACSSDSSDTSAAPPSAAVVKATVTIPDLSIKVSGEMTQVTVDPNFLAALTSLKVMPAIVGSANLTNGVLTFPITGGNVNVFDNTKVSPYVTGVIFHEGSGLSLTAGDKKVELTNFVVDPGASKLYGDVTLNGQAVGKHLYLFFLDGRTLKPAQSVSTSVGTSAVLEGTQVKLSRLAADQLNMVYGITALKENLLIGVAKITVNP